MCFIITSLQCGDINKEQNTVRIQMEINRHNCNEMENRPQVINNNHKTLINYTKII